MHFKDNIFKILYKLSFIFYNNETTMLKILN